MAGQLIPEYILSHKYLNPVGLMFSTEFTQQLNLGSVPLYRDT